MFKIQTLQEEILSKSKQANYETSKYCKYQKYLQVKLKEEMERKKNIKGLLSVLNIDNVIIKEKIYNN